MGVSRTNAILSVYDVIVVNIALYLGLLLRFEHRVPRLFVDNWQLLVLLTSLAYIASFTLFRMYSRVWRYASLKELIALGAAVFFGSAGTVSLILFVNRSLMLPRSVVALQILISGAMLGGARLLIKVGIYQRYLAWKSRQGGKKAILVGAGDAGALILKELQRHSELGISVKAIVDDDPKKRNKEIYGVKVRGNAQDLPSLIASEHIDEVIIAMPSAPGTAVRRIVRVCQDKGVKIKVLPGLYELVDGKATVGQLREVQIEDLLHREPIRIDTSEISRFLHGKRVMVTGGGGSIGSELCRQIAKFEPEFLVILDNSENNLYHIELELRKKMPNLTLFPVVASIQDQVRIDGVFQQFRPQVVFHAAAHKHVPMMEYNPGEAVKNNIFGTKTVAEAASRYGAEKFVLISTDKAVNPTNVMGATKRAAEMVIQWINETSQTEFVAVRFGNVLGSNGSVVPLFKKQIAEGGPVTVTHPEMTRYFMTIPEACQLVLQAGHIGRGGQVMLLDMGEPVKIKELAEDLIRFSGYEPGRDIDIRYVGLRPGEKLYEELLADEENTNSTQHEKIYTAILSQCDFGHLRFMLERMVQVVQTAEGQAIRTLLQNLVDTYKPMNVPVAQSAAAEVAVAAEHE